MRRELIWAGIIGISFGIILAFGAWRINSSLKSGTTRPTSTPSSQNPVTELKITLSSPGENDVVTASSIRVTGITKSLTWVVVSGEKGDYILQSDEKGVFEQSVDLAAGVNQIRITAFDKTGNQSVQKVLVVYSSAFQVKTVPTPTPGSTASGEAEIREKVAQKVSEALNQPKAYIGVVTDITDSTIQIKTSDSEIKQISVAGSAITVANTKGTNNKQVKLTDIAIGDFIVAMGYVNQKSVLNAQRILITDPLVEPQIGTSFGSSSDLTKKSLSVTDAKSGQKKVVTPGKNTDIQIYKNGKASTAKITDIATGDLIIVVTSTDAKGNTITRSVFDLGQPQA